MYGYCVKILIKCKSKVSGRQVRHLLLTELWFLRQTDRNEVKSRFLLITCIKIQLLNFCHRSVRFKSSKNITKAFSTLEHWQKIKVIKKVPDLLAHKSTVWLTPVLLLEEQCNIYCSFLLSTFLVFSSKPT